MTPEMQKDLRDAELAKARAVFAQHKVLQPDDPGNCGFRDLGEFLAVARRAAHKSVLPQMRDRRIQAIQNSAPTSLGSEGVGSDGGFAVPPAFIQDITSQLLAADGLLAATDLRASDSNSYTIPKDETAPWDNSSGIRVFWESEAAQATQSKPSMTNATVKLAKITALVPVTDELVEDAPRLMDHIRAKAPEKIAFAVENAIINGTGAGQPKGILSSAGTIVVAKESGQAAGTVVHNNITKMWNRLTYSARKGGWWLCHPDIEQQLQTLQFPITTTAGAGAPMYAPPSAVAPFGTLLGRPIYPTEACKKAGTQGDIVFGNPAGYLAAMKKIRADISVHIWFDYDLTAFKFVLRIGGQPWTDNAVTGNQANTNTRGFFATLAARS